MATIEKIRFVRGDSTVTVAVGRNFEKRRVVKIITTGADTFGGNFLIRGERLKPIARINSSFVTEVFYAD